MFTQVVNLVVIPLGVIIFGVIRLIIRRRRVVLREQEG
jgi:hypothetical protein